MENQRHARDESNSESPERVATTRPTLAELDQWMDEQLAVLEARWVRPGDKAKLGPLFGSRVGRR